MTSPADMGNKLFAGVKVLAVARVIAAPFAAMQLALNGADVLTIENPEEGDSQRNSEWRREWMGMGRAFLAFNLNKRSMTLAINTPEGQEIFRKLAKDADVIIENLRTGGMAKYGLAYEDIQKINPRIIYCSITGYGQTGPKARDPGIDDAIQAASGMMSLTGTPESGPLKTGTTVVDFCSGYVSAFTIAGALYQRTRTGVGQAIDLSMMEVAMTMIGGEVTRAATSGDIPPLVGNGNGRSRYVSNSFRCKEGHIMVAARADNLRGRFFKAIDRTDIPEDERFNTMENARKNLDQMNAEIEKTMLTRTASDWETYLNEKGIPAMRVLSLPEAIKHPQIAARKFLRTFPDEPGVIPSHTVPTAPYRLSVSSSAAERRAPRLGEHTDIVLKDLGYSSDEIAKLREQKTV